jgi:hypothetical protein
MTSAQLYPRSSPLIMSFSLGDLSRPRTSCKNDEGADSDWTPVSIPCFRLPNGRYTGRGFILLLTGGPVLGFLHSWHAVVKRAPSPLFPIRGLAVSASFAHGGRRQPPS